MSKKKETKPLVVGTDAEILQILLNPNNTQENPLVVSRLTKESQAQLLDHILQNGVTRVSFKLQDGKELSAIRDVYSIVDRYSLRQCHDTRVGNLIKIKNSCITARKNEAVRAFPELLFNKIQGLLGTKSFNNTELGIVASIATNFIYYDLEDSEVRTLMSDKGAHKAACFMCNIRPCFKVGDDGLARTSPQCGFNGAEQALINNIKAAITYAVGRPLSVQTPARQRVEDKTSATDEIIQGHQTPKCLERSGLFRRREEQRMYAGSSRWA